MPPRRFLDRLSRLSVLTAGDIDIVQALPWSREQVQRARDFVRIGDELNCLYVIEDGWAARYAVRPDGSRRITGFMLPGDFCGIHTIANEAIDHAIIAITNCTVACVPQANIKDAITRSATLNESLWHAKLIDEAILRVWLAGSKDAEKSLAHLICELHARVTMTGDVGDSKFQAPLSQEQLGDALGLTNVHVNRMVRQLRERGLADINSREISVPDIIALRRSCSFSPEYLHAIGR